MKNKFYKREDKKIDIRIEEARTNRRKFYDIKKRSLESIGTRCQEEVSNAKICDENLSYDDEYSKFEFKSYNFVTFEDTKWGRDLAFSEIFFVEINEVSFFYVDFKGCLFQNIIFNGCSFVGCKFENCSTSTGKVIFENCNLRDTEIEYNGTNHEIIPISNEFSNCKMIKLDIRNSLVDSIIFDYCTLISSELKDNDMPNTIFNKCGFYGVDVEDCKLNGLKIKDIINFDLKFNKTKSDKEVDTDIYISKLSLKGYKKRIQKEYQKYRNEKLTENEFIKEKYIEVAKLFYTIATVLKTSNFNDDNYREYAYMHNKYIMMTKNDFWDRCILFMSWILFGFGERMGRFLLWICIYIITFSSV